MPLLTYLRIPIFKPLVIQGQALSLSLSHTRLTPIFVCVFTLIKVRLLLTIESLCLCVLAYALKAKAHCGISKLLSEINASKTAE